MNNEVQGYEVPIHRALTQPIYWMGVPRGLLFLEVIGALLGGLIFKTFMVVVIAFFAHMLFRYLGTQDPDFLGVFFRASKHKLYYYR